MSHIDSFNADSLREENLEHDLIYDLGFHIGQDTDFYLKKGYRVVAVEANPELCDLGLKNFKKYIRSKQLTLLNLGIAESNASLPFYINHQYSEWSSFDEKIGKSRGEYTTINVETAPLCSLIEKYGMPFYLKIDIEAFDNFAIQSLKKFRIKPKYISTENCGTYSINELHMLGYNKFKFINQANVDKIKISSTSIKGKKLKHHFVFGSSGPFGEETEGHWLSKEEVTIISEEYWNNPNRNANIHGWFDLHAALD